MNKASQPNWPARSASNLSISAVSPALPPSARNKATSTCGRVGGELAKISTDPAGRSTRARGAVFNGLVSTDDGTQLEVTTTSAGRTQLGFMAILTRHT